MAAYQKKNQLLTLGRILRLCVFIFSLYFIAKAQTTYALPGVITHQGKLTDNNGVTLADGNQSIRFVLYTASTGGTCVYTAGGTCSSTSALTVSVTDGIFSVDLGAGTTNTINPTIFIDNADLYLEITVGSDSAMTPRKRLTNAPFAYNALYLSGLATSTIGGTQSFVPVTDSNGNLRLSGSTQGTAYTQGVLQINPTSTPAADRTLLGVSVNGAGRFKVDAEGDLTLTSGSATTTIYQSDSSYTVSSTGNLVLAGGGSSQVSFYAGDATRMVVDSSGRVGVGSSTPSATFTLGGTAGSISMIIDDADGSAYDFYYNSSVGDFIGISSSSPGRALDVGGGFMVAGSTILGDAAGDSLVVNASSSLYANVLLGDATSDVITIRGRINSDFNPNVNNTYTLGSQEGLRWSSVDAAGPLRLADGTNSSTLSVTALTIGIASGSNSGVFDVTSAGAVSASSTLSLTGSTAAARTLQFIGAGTVTSTAGGLTVGGNATTTLSGFPGTDALNSGTGALVLRSTRDLTTAPLLLFQDNTTDRLSVLATSTDQVVFRSNVSDAAGTRAFVFDTANTLTSGTDRYLLSVRNNGVARFAVSAGGNVYATESFIANAGGGGPGDVAEEVLLSPGESVGPGDVLIADLLTPNHYKKSTSAHSREVAGVISKTGKFIIGRQGDGPTAPLALAGLVGVNVTDEGGSIQPGDILVTASTAGHAMKYNPEKDNPDFVGVLGTALEPHTTGAGTVMALIKTGWVQSKHETLTTVIEDVHSIGRATGIGVKSALRTSVTVQTGDTGAVIPAPTTSLFDGIASRAGAWEITEDGRIVAKEIVAERFVVQAREEENASVGIATIPAGQKEITVPNILVRPESRIFITFLVNPQGPWWISEKKDGYFKVSLIVAPGSDVGFEYWVLGVEREDVRAEEVEVTAEERATQINDEAPTSTGATPEVPSDVIMSQSKDDTVRQIFDSTRTDIDQGGISAEEVSTASSSPEYTLLPSADLP